MGFFAVLGLSGCTSNPVYVGLPPAGRILSVAPGSRVAIFTLLVRRINSSRSQGQNWYAELGARDYEQFSSMVRIMFERDWKAELVPAAKIRESGVYRSGAFPTRVPFFLNPEHLPVVASREHPELMLRSAAELRADLFVVALLDFEISKLFGQAASISTSAELHVYSAHAGLLGLLTSADDRRALPYDDSLPLSDRPRAYRDILEQTIRKSFIKTLGALSKQVATVAVPEPTSP